MHAAQQPRHGSGAPAFTVGVQKRGTEQPRAAPCTACCCCHLDPLLLVACCRRAQKALHLLLPLLLLLACWLVAPASALGQFGCNTADTTAMSIEVCNRCVSMTHASTVNQRYKQVCETSSKMTSSGACTRHSRMHTAHDKNKPQNTLSQRPIDQRQVDAAGLSHAPKHHRTGDIYAETWDVVVIRGCADGELVH
jgi:hypothetical protein